jgi:hypothetical protein
VSRLLVLGVSLAALASACGGTGGGEGFISTKATVAALRDAGFRDLVSSEEAYRNRKGIYKLLKLFRPSAQRPDIDLILSSSGGSTVPYVPIFALRFPSAQSAKRTYDQGYSQQSLKAQVAELRRNKYAFPPGFSLSRLRTARVCNIVISSYNARTEPPLDARLNHAITLLRNKC